MIDKLKVGAIYRLIDGKSYFASSAYNYRWFGEYSVDSCFILSDVDKHGSGLIDGVEVICAGEYKFFEEVPSEVKSNCNNTISPPTLWDGARRTLKAGLHVKNGDVICEVLFYWPSSDKVLIAHPHGLEYYVGVDEINATVKSDKDLFKEATLEKLNLMPLTRTFSDTTLSDVLDAAYEVATRDGVPTL